MFDGARPGELVETGPPRLTLRNAFVHPFDSAIAAARTCYSPRLIGPEEITDKQRLNIGAATFYSGHHTVYQHAHFEFGLEMSMLINGVMSAVEGGSADVEALLVGDLFRADEAGGIAGTGGGNRRVKGMNEGVAESDARRPGLDEFTGARAIEHARLRGHVGSLFYRKERARTRLVPRLEARHQAARWNAVKSSVPLSVTSWLGRPGRWRISSGS